MKRMIAITDLPDLEKGTFVIMYECDKPVDSGIITDKRESLGIIIFQSASKKEEPPMPLMWDSPCGIWVPTFKDPMSDKMVFSQNSPAYRLQEDERRIPLVLS